jgi:hypothetical protein
MGTTAADAVLIDVRNTTPPERLQGEGALSKLVSERLWQFDFAEHLSPEPSVFYDTDGDRAIDHIMTADESGAVRARFTRDAQGRWHAADGAGAVLVSGRYFKDPSVGRRFARLHQALVSGQ